MTEYELSKPKSFEPDIRRFGEGFIGECFG
jgi:hypothetical protein